MLRDPSQKHPPTAKPTSPNGRMIHLPIASRLPEAWVVMMDGSYARETQTFGC